MPRLPRALVALVACAVLLVACGNQAATEGSVRNDVRASLLRNENLDLTEEEATAVGDCVSREIFQSGDFSKEERDEATSADDGDDPDPDLAAKVQAVVDGCLDEADTVDG